MEIHFCHVFGIVWISVSRKIFEKPITLECLCFPILFPYHGNPLLPCFWNCMDFCVTQNIWETYNFGMFVFSHTFPLPWKSTFPIFLELYGFLCHPKYLRNLQLWNVCIFPHFSHAVEIHFPHVLRIVWISVSPKIFKKPINLECLCFPILFLYYENPLFPCFEFWELYGFLLLAKYVRNTWPRNVLFSHTFPALSAITLPMF